MEENKPRIEDDFKNLIKGVKNNYKGLFPTLEFSFLKDYDKDTHIGLFLIYNILYLVTFVCWLFLFILGFEFENGFSIIKFTKDYFFTGEFVTLDAWRIHLVINLILFFMCLDYGKTEMKRQRDSNRPKNRKELLQFYKGRGWKFPKEDGKD
jgi:hypothetical protein